jgi:hypothetical protein
MVSFLLVPHVQVLKCATSTWEMHPGVVAFANMQLNEASDILDWVNGKFGFM